MGYSNCVRCAIDQEISVLEKELHIIGLVDGYENTVLNDKGLKYLEEKVTSHVARQTLFSKAEMKRFMKDVRKSFGIDDE
jgi:hypothetical protein